MRTIFTLTCCFLLTAIFAQENQLLVMGKVLSSRDSLPVEGAIVICRDPQRQTISGKNGHYAILLGYKTGQTLEFRRLGFRTERRTINSAMLRRAGGDTLQLDVYLQAESELGLVVITPGNGPDTVIGNWHFFIEDYQILNDSQYVLLTFERSLKASKVMLADDRQRILSSFEVPGEAIELYRDYLGDINVLCRDSAFRVKIVPPGRLLLLALPYRDFCDRMLPCVDTINGKILFSNYTRNYPAFSWFTYDPRDTTVELLRYIADKELLAQYNWEFDYLQPKQRLYARKIAAYTGIDPRVIAATMTGFPESIYYTPLYAPLCVVHDTICVFDHYSDSLFLFSKAGAPIGAVKIDYHHPKNWKEWDRAIIKDEVTGEIYARFEKDGYYTLKKIDIRTGKITGTYKITNRFVKHIHIRNGAVYYIYQPFESLQKKFLYKEQITVG